MNALGPTDAYRMWAPTYSAENAVTQIEDELVRSLTPPLQGLRLLDAGCGTGRRLSGTAAAEMVGVDISPDMLACGIAALAAVDNVRFLTGDVASLPLADESFDVTWCRLMIGHCREIGKVYAELARVTRRGGCVIVTDFHPAAHAAGHRRTFRAQAEVHEIEHHVHSLPTHLASAGESGLESIAVDEGCIGESVRHFYVARGLHERFDADAGLPIVLALAFRRTP